MQSNHLCVAAATTNTICTRLRLHHTIHTHTDGTAAAAAAVLAAANIKELRRALAAAGAPMTDIEAAACVAALGHERSDGLIDKSHFLALLRAPMSERRWQVRAQGRRCITGCMYTCVYRYVRVMALLSTSVLSLAEGSGVADAYSCEHALRLEVVEVTPTGQSSAALSRWSSSVTERLCKPSNCTTG